MSDGYCWCCGGHDEQILIASEKTWCRECAAGEIELLVAAIASWKAEEVEWKETEAKLLARVEELEESRGILKLCTPTTKEEAEVYDRITAGLIRGICESRGYGNVMQAAAALWYAKDADGAFTCGPCAATIRTAIGGEDE